MHTSECLKYQEDREAARAAWMARWPNHCTRCEGAGGREIPATQWEPPDYDMCACMDSGKCPRCGIALDLVDQDGELLDGDCGGCGWTGRGNDDVCPPPFDGCGCDDVAGIDPFEYGPDLPLSPDGDIDDLLGPYYERD